MFSRNDRVDLQYEQHGPDGTSGQYDSIFLTQARNHRWRVFLITFGIALVFGLGFTWLRPPVYESTAILRISYPQSADQQDDAFVREQLIIHQQRINSRRILSDVATRLRSGSGLELTSDQISQMVDARPIPDSRLLELQATGNESALLAPLLQHWIDLYLQQFSDAQQSESINEKRELAEQLQALKEKIDRKRSDLEEFQQAHQIISLERDENRALSKIKALGAALDTATAEKVQASARLSAIEESVRSGKPAVRPQDQPGIDNLEARAGQLEEQLEDYAVLYTAEYMKMDRKILAIERKLERIRSDIRTKTELSQQVHLQEARQDLATAEKKEAAIQQELDAFQKQVQNFSNRLAEFSALNRELEELELQAQEIRNEGVQMEVKLPYQSRVEILEPPFLPTSPVSPDYWRDTAISLAAAVALALLAVTFYTLIFQRQQTEIVLNPNPRLKTISGPAVRDSLPSGERRQLVDQATITLTPEECRRLIEAATPPCALAIMLVLSGLKPEELAALRWQDVDLEAGLLHVPGSGSRDLRLLPKVATLCRQIMPAAPTPQTYVWSDADSTPLSAEELDTMVICAADDAGFREPEQVSLYSLHHSYLMYLVQQGLRLSELAQCVGYLKADTLNRYRMYTRPGPAKSACEIDMQHPALG